MAVSNPSPKRMPMGYIFHGVSIRAGQRPEEAVHQAPLVELALELLIVVAALAHLA